MSGNQVKVDDNGNWNYQVPENLEPGTYTITLKGTDSNGNQIEKPYTFTISASVSDPLQNPLPNTGIETGLLGVSFLLLLVGVFLLVTKRKRSFEERIVRL